MGGSFSNTNRNISPAERKDLSAVDTAILENCVVMFSTTSCKYCNKAKQSLTDFGVRFKVVELDLLGRNSFKVSSELSLKTGQRTVPQIFVNGKFVGGYTEMEQLKNAGKLIELYHQCASSSQ
eukprot:Seg417.9 transcript_id=Seg417.9/GoldUCD/mRNA.D3Y31 product="Glutaredoxin-2 mitochondrial" protein_id=Seg417.9/GoldUCD/D3Y31